MKPQLIKRIEGFLWHGGAMLLVFYLDTLLETLPNYNLSANVVLLIGLIIPQITKWLRNKYVDRSVTKVID